MKLLLSLTVFLFSSLGLAGDGAHGGGIGEKTVLFTHLSMHKYLKACLGSRKCDLTAPELKLVKRILKNLEAVPSSKEQIAFRSEKEFPGTFQLAGQAHGAVRSAMTGGQPGAPILVNSDHLYSTSPKGSVEPIDIPTSASILLDELAHHAEPSFADTEKHAKLDLLCAKFRIFMMSATQTIDFKPESAQLGASFVHSESGSEMLLFDPVKTRDLTELIHAEAVKECRGYRLTGVHIQNPHWHVATNIIEVNERSRTSKTTVHAWINIKCDNRPAPFHQFPRRHNLYVTFQVTKTLADARQERWDWRVASIKELEITASGAGPTPQQDGHDSCSYLPYDIMETKD